MSYEANEPCCGCGLEGEGMVTYHHIYTRKAYPELSEVKWNMMPVCLICHNKIHANTLSEFSKNRKTAEDWLISNDWYFDYFFGKWRNENGRNYSV